MAILKLFLFPISIFYGLIVKIRNLLFDHKIIKSFKPNVKTICIGNVTVGGTGKTPHVDYLIQLLSSTQNIATLSRGYGRKTKGFRYVSVNSKAIEVGDEPLQLKQKHQNQIVAVDERRVNGIKQLLVDYPDLTLVLLDDAFQHRYLKPGLSILLMDYNQPIYHDFFLPYGRLRDSIQEIRRADIVLVTKCPTTLTPEEQLKIKTKLNLHRNQHLFFTIVDYGTVFPVFSDNSRKIFLDKNQNVFAITGIANPKPFYTFLDQNSTLAGMLTFPDHFHYTEKKIRSIFETSIKQDSIVITTEKDAVRLKDLVNLGQEIKSRIYYIPIEVRFIGNQEVEFNKIITDYARKD